MEYKLRPVKASDVDILYNWVNDIDVRRNSFSQKKISYEEHCKWFCEKINDSSTELYILENGETNIGLIRLEFNDDKILISYSIMREERGKGYGEKIILMAENLLKKEHSSQKYIMLAKVKHGNIASRRVFAKLGFAEAEENGYLIYRKSLC